MSKVCKASVFGLLSIDGTGFAILHQVPPVMVDCSVPIVEADLHPSVPSVAHVPNEERYFALRQVAIPICGW